MTNHIKEHQQYHNPTQRGEVLTAFRKQVTQHRKHGFLMLSGPHGREEFFHFSDYGELLDYDETGMLKSVPEFIEKLRAEEQADRERGEE